ncbi:MAG: GntR family transcriptional regulator [Ideonella sp. MAG2]|nr:MAG: GntR family transcriptional regulator [Ideonella sp. MAG2]
MQPMDFAVTPSDPTPIYRQIVDQVRRYIAGGHWPAGHELPSVRAVALTHAINPMTVSKAYSQLEAEGLLARRRGMGMVVADQSQAQADQRTALLMPTLEAAARQAQQLGLSPEEALAAFEQALHAAHNAHETAS